jgi:SAM-dependent methyltransferase
MTQSTPSSHYSFGDSDLAATRLSLLAETYEATTRELIEAYVPPTSGLAIDLGCGLGHTTALLARLRPSATVFGYERSKSNLSRARTLYPNLNFVEQDVLRPPYAHSKADLVYSRFLLTHLDSPENALFDFASLLGPKGLLVVEETAHLASPDDTLQRYYCLVHELQSHYGQELYIGRKLDAFARRKRLGIVLSRQRAFPICARRMARLHAMNLATWKQDPYMAMTHRAEELNELESELVDLAERRTPPAPVTCTMAQLVLETGS